MSETQFPSGYVQPGQSAGTANGQPSAVKIVNLPEAIQQQVENAQIPVRVRGEIVQQNNDGSVRVRTEAGDIDIRLREGQRPPPQGRTIEVEVSPNRQRGQPPESGQVREVSTQPQRPAETAPQPPPQRPSATPVNVEVRGGEAPPQPTPVPVQPFNRPVTPPSGNQALPPEGAVVRLQPLPIRTAQALPLPDIAQFIASTVSEPAVFQAQVLSQQARGDLQQAVLDIRAPALPQAFAQTPQGLQQNIPDILQPARSFPFITETVFTPPSAVQVAKPPAQILALQLPVYTLQLPPLGPVPVSPPQTFIQAQASGIKNQVQGPVSVSQTLPQIFTPSPGITPPTSSPPQIAQAGFTPVPLVLKSQTLDVRIESVSPPPVTLQPPGLKTDRVAPNIQNTSSIIQNQKAGSLTGIVTNITASQLPVLSVFFPALQSEQIFTLQFPSENITIGTQIQVTPQTPNVANPVLNPAATQILPLPVFLSPQPWPAMEEILQTLARVAPQAAQAMINVTPSPASPAQLPPALMFFVAALRGGDLSQWLGQKATDLLKIEKGGGPLNRLLGEGQTLSRIASEPTPQDWRALNIPLYWDGDMHKIGLYYKHEHEENAAGDKTLKGTRFVFDLALERMGKVQLDGLFRPVSDAGKRLDLVVRTEDHFAQSTQAEMRRTYARALRDSGVTGELSFQTQPESWVSIQADKDRVLGVSA